jgi:hypothetical protein
MKVYDQRGWRLVRALVALMCGIAVSCAWCHTGRMLRKYAGKSRSDLFMDGMTDTVAAIRDEHDSRVYGPPPEFSPYIFQRMSEMLYPVEYVSAGKNGVVGRGALCVLLPAMEINMPHDIVATNGLFRLARIK